MIGAKHEAMLNGFPQFKVTIGGHDLHLPLITPPSLAPTHIGLTPDGSSSYFLTRILGMRRTAELYLTNRALAPRRCWIGGLVNQVLPAADLKEEVD